MPPGRPVVGENDVGRERLLAAAKRLLRQLPPARVTIARIAQEANADPALVRYHFGDRSALLRAVADRIATTTRCALPSSTRRRMSRWPSTSG